MAVNNFSGTTVNSLFAAGKNAILNGAFDIWQRGTSFTQTGGATQYTSDRWMAWATAAGTQTQVTRQSSGLGGFNYCLRFQRPVGNTNTGAITLLSALETSSSIPLAGQAVTFSFYARKGVDYSAAASALSTTVYYGTGTDQAPYGFTGATTVATSTVTLTASWQRFTMTGTVNAAATQIGMNFTFNGAGTAGAADYFEITGVQLEAGSVATPFARNGANIAAELAACQRYYWRTTSGSAYTTLCTSGYSLSTTAFAALIKMPVTMRIAPTAVDYSTLYIAQRTTTTADVVVTSATLGEANQEIAQVTFSGSGGLTANHSGYIKSNNSASAYIGLSAEL